MELRREFRGHRLALLLLLACSVSRPLMADSLFSHIELPVGQLDALEPVIPLDTYLPHQSISDLDTKFDVFTSASQYGIAIEFSDAKVPFNKWELERSKLNTSAPTVVIIPGYQLTAQIEWAYTIVDRWRKLDEQANVIMVSWMGGRGVIYSTAVANGALVARQISIFLAYLAEASGTSLKDPAFLERLQLVGFSLGAHIAGYVGQDLQGRVGRIVGLDPAGPSFDQMPKEHRLSDDDAQLVQVLHTNMGQMRYRNAAVGATMHAFDTLVQKLPLIGRAREDTVREYAGDYTAWFGIDLQLGHLDYYANGGREQPGCEDVMHICDHKRSQSIYVSLLERQTRIRRLFGEHRALEASPMTFYADSYQQFLHEGSVQTRCFHDEQTWSEGCGAPLDLVGPPGDIRRLPRNRDKLFFLTNKNDPLVGEQYLFQVALAREIAWDASCSLQLTFTFAGNQTRTVVLNKELKATGNKMMAIPFAGPQTYEALETLGKIADESPEFPINANNEQTEWIRHSLPREVNVSISSSKDKIRSAISSVMDVLSLGLYKYDEKDRCQLVMKSVEIRALFGGLRRSIVGTYRDSFATYRIVSSRTDTADLAELHLQSREKSQTALYLSEVVVGPQTADA